MKSIEDFLNHASSEVSVKNWRDQDSIFSEWLPFVQLQIRSNALQLVETRVLGLRGEENSESVEITVTPGEFNVECVGVRFGDDARIAALRVYPKEQNIIIRGEKIGEIPVDIGGIAVVDIETIEPSIKEESESYEDWLEEVLYGASNTSLLSVHLWKPTETLIPCIEGGFGDGLYNVYELKSSNGETVGLEIEFISDTVPLSWFEIANQMEPDIRRGDIDACINRVIEELQKLPETPFHNVVNYRFTNKPEEIANAIESFIQKEQERIEIKSIYLEMNSFDINPEEWFFDLFAYKSYNGHDDYDWLSNWQSLNHDSIILNGLEEMQKIYDNYDAGEYDYEEEEKGEDYSNVRDICSLLITLYFHDLIKRAAPLIKSLQVPILATAHGYDFIYEYSI